MQFHRWNKSVVRYTVTIIMLLIGSMQISAQQPVQVIWPLTSDGEAVYSSGIGSASFKPGPGLSSFRYDSINGATATGWNSRNLNPSAYYEYTIVPERDATLQINQLKFEVSLSSVNMRTALYYSKDGFEQQSVPMGNTVFVGKKSSRDLLVETSITVTYPETLSIRVYGWSAPTPAVSFYAGNVEFSGVIVEEEEEKVSNVVPDNDIIIPEDSGEKSVRAISVFDLSGTWTCPANVFKVTVECWGGGGKGGSANGNNRAGGGGGGGGYSNLIDYTVVPGNVYTVTVGTGGITLSNGTITNGTDSWFNTNATVRARGGTSVANNNVNGAAGGPVGTGTNAYTGGNGANGNTASFGGGGGASGDSGGNGVPGLNSLGGIAPAGGGNGGNGYLTTALTPSGGGADGNAPGGGGGGALSLTGSGDFNGGDGSNGRVVITYCVIPTVYNVTGGGSYCAGGSGVPVGLGDSDLGISYRLYRNVTTPVGAPMNGTGNALNFGNQTVAGTYTVIATNLDGACTQNMNGSAVVTVNPLPSASISGTTTVCQNTASPDITFTGSVGTAPYIFTYKINGGANIVTAPGNPILVSVPTNTVGTFIYSLVSVLDANGCSRTISGSATVTVTPGTPAAPGAITGNTSPCPLVTGLQYSVAAVPNATSYNWTLPTGWTQTGGGTGNVITVTAGSFGQNGDISVTASNNCGTSSASVLPVSVLPGTPATPGPITGLANQCPSISAVYSISAVTNATNYTWTVPTGWTISSGNGTTSITVLTGASGQNGNITVRASNSCGTSSPRNLAVIVGAGIPVSPGGINGLAVQCPNIPNLTYSINPVANATSYNWTVPTGWSITGGNGTTTITVTSGAFGDNGNISVTASNNCGNSPAATLAVTVSPGTPAIPGPVSGTVVQCSNITGQIYSIAPVTNATSYNWTVPTGWTINSGQGTTSITVTTGTFGQNGNITVTASNSCGTSAQSFLAVTINPGAPVAPGPISGITNHCFQQNGQLYSIASVTNATTYTWTVPTGWTITSGNGTTSIVVNTGTPGQNGNITVTAGNLCGTGAASTIAVVVSTVPAPTSAISPDAPTTVCQAATLTFSVTAVAGVTYTWEFPSDWVISSGQGTNQVIVVVGAQSGIITVTPSNTCGNGIPTTRPVTVNPLPPSVDPIEGESDFCQGMEQKYKAKNIPGLTYNWTVPAGWIIISGQGTQSITVAVDGLSGLVEVTPQNDCGYGPTSSKYINVFPLPAAETGPDGELCKGGFATIGAPAVPGNTYEWTSVPPGFTSNISNPVVNPFVTTTYYLTETTLKGCSQTNDITIVTEQNLFITLDPIDQTICPGASFTINVTSNILGTTYEWERDNTTVLTGMAANGTTVPINGTLNSSNPTGSETTTFTVTGISSGLNCGDKVEAKVTVIDNTAPILQCPVDPVRSTNTGLCTYTVVGAELDPIVTDNCSVTLINSYNSTSTLAGAVFPKGTTSVKWTATDPGGFTAQCDYNLTVIDNIPPSITCIGNQIVNVSGSDCFYTHSGNSWDAIATDNCPNIFISYQLTDATSGTGTSLDGVQFSLGVTTIEWTASDGNNSVLCSYTVTVVDNVPPTIFCPTDVIASSSPTTCNALLTLDHPVIDDNCTGSTLTWSITGSTSGNGNGFVPDNYTFNVGTSLVNYVITDQAGLTDNCSFQVTVNDNTLPIVTCPAVNDFYPNIFNQCQATLSFVATASDNCAGIQSIKYYIGLTEITFPYNFPVGTTNVSAIATDVNGNESVPCTFEVEVRDTQLPVMNCVASPQYRDANDGECTYIVQGTEFDPTFFSDNCPGATIINDFNQLTSLSGAVLPQGNIDIIWTVTDASGNIFECPLNIIVNDGEAPVIICPGNRTENTGAGSSACSKIVTFPNATALDNCDTGIIPTCIPSSGSTFPVGTTTVTCTGVDGSGNVGECTFTVTVIDNTPPTFTAPIDITVNTGTNCIYDINPAVILSQPSGQSDNCQLANPSTTYSDVIEAVPPCQGNYKVTRTWRVTDIYGNYSESIQIIMIRDNTAPLITVPTSRYVECSDPLSSYGVATATDNCDTDPVISFTDVEAPLPGCPSGKIITRTWRAEDCNGNFSTGDQTITVDDNTPPVINNPGNTQVQCPSMIPSPSAANIIAYDNCGSVTFEFVEDDAFFPEGATGYCPDYIHRYFNAIDQCNNRTLFYQLIDIVAPLSTECDCKECQSINSSYDVNLEENTTVTISNAIRLDKCCNADKQEVCISFNVYLPPSAVGVQIQVNGGHPDNEFWKVDCEIVHFLEGDFVCLPGGAYYLFTYCKAGQNTNNIYTFTVLEGIISAPDIDARVSCNSLITANTTAEAVSWHSIAPGAFGQWDSYLTCLDPQCTQVQFTPDENAPDVIVYQVCGTLEDMPCFGAGGTSCDEVTVYVHEDIEVTFNVDPGAYCNDAIPEITATVYPSGTTYELEWFKEPDLTTVLGTGYTYLPTSEGNYVLKVHDTDEGVPCPDYLYYFTVAPDDQPPVITPPAPLELECEDPTNTAQITAWLASATAIDDHSINIIVNNNYSGITQDCNSVVTVTFSAVDECLNPASVSSTITILDTQNPTWSTGSVDLNRTVECSDAAGLAAANLLVPEAVDLCDDDVTNIVKTPGTLVPGSCPQAGTITNTFMATDDCGNVTLLPFEQVITITDATPPTWTTGAGLLNRNVTCNDVAGLAAAQALTPAAIDICDPSVTVTKTAGPPIAGVCPILATYTNTFIATDACGNVSTVYTQVITVNDILLPVITAQPTSTSVECDGAGNLTELTNWLNNHGGATATDQCDTDLEWTSDFTALSDLCGATGSATVIFTATDECGNFVNTNAVTFTIIDTQAPSITCPPPATATVDPGTCEVTGVDIGTASAIDNCSAIGEIVITNDAPVSFPGGVTIVTWTATDNCGNFISCQQTVTVEDDIPPTIECPPDVEATAPAPECELQVPNIEYPIITDNCDISLLTLSWVKSGATTGTGTGDVNNTLFNVGVTLVTYTVTDSWGNTDECSFTVTVNDEVPPTIINCHNEPINVNNEPGECFANVIIQTPEAIDECGEEFTIVNDYNNTSNASDEYPVGTTIVIWTITDDSGNETKCQVSVTVTDVETPDIVCPNDVEGLITGNGCILENFPVPDPVITENCLYTVSWIMTGATVGSGTGFVGGEDFGIGITYVTYTITDASGQTDNCSFQVWIKNLDEPQFEATCPIETVTATTDPDRCDALVDVPPPTISNPCGELYSISHDSPYSSDPNDASGIYPIGITPFTWTIIDASGNIKTCPQTVTVTDDQYPTIVCPGDVTVTAAPPECEIPNVVLEEPAYGDNCDDPVLTWGMNGPAGTTSGSGLVTQTTFPVGTTVITYYVTDASSHVTECSFNVVVRDEVPPTIVSCPPGQTLDAEDGKCSADVTIPPPVVDDDCGEIVSITHNSLYSTNPLNASGTYPVGIHIITWTFTDESGNIEECTTIITVEDKQLPVIDCPEDVEQELINGDCELANVIIPDPIISDNCDLLSLSWIMTGATTGTSSLTGFNYVSGETFEVGTTTVTYLLTDENDNTVECSFTVLIKDLTPAFEATCPADVNEPSEPTVCGATVTVPKPGIYNPCNELYTVTNDSPYAEDDASGFYLVGTTYIEWIITDASGNVTPCTQTVTITDLPAVLDCPDDQVYNADFEQNYSSIVVPGIPTYSDNCGIASLTWTSSAPTPGSSSSTGININTNNLFYVGVTTITYTATDNKGNETECSFTITVLSKPEIECPIAISTTTDPDECSATLNPGGPTLISGVEPIVWHYSITNEAGTEIGFGDCTTANLSTCIGDFEFPVGVNTIHWTATNMSGMDECTQTVTVVDDEPPTYTAPSLFERCVNQIITAKYDGAPEPDADIIPIDPAHGNPRRPDWYLVASGSTELDLMNLSDNCCVLDDINISWTIVFDPITGYSPISGFGQPSLSTPIYLWGTYTNVPVTHIITFTISDCNGNAAAPISRNLLITPRPDIIKQY